VRANRLEIDGDFESLRCIPRNYLLHSVRMKELSNARESRWWRQRNQRLVFYPYDQKAAVLIP
jgi:hypothetical protein